MLNKHTKTKVYFNHTLCKFMHNKHTKKKKFTSINEEIQAMKSQEVNFQKLQKLLASRAGSSKQIIVRTALRNPPLKLNE